MRGRLYDGPGFPLLQVPRKTSSPRAPQTPWPTWPHRRAGPGGRGPSPPRGRTRHSGRLGRRVRGADGLRRPRIPFAGNRPPGGLPSGRFQPLPAGAGPGEGERRLRVRVGLHGRDDGHQAAPDRLRPLAGVRPADRKSILLHERRCSPPQRLPAVAFKQGRENPIDILAQYHLF